MTNSHLIWHESVVNALIKSRPDPILKKHLDQILQWLSGSKTDDSIQISKTIRKYGANEDVLKSTAYLLLELLLFTNTQNPYDVFASKTGTSAKYLKIRYRRLVKLYHPDHSQYRDVDKRTAITEIINRAFDDIKNNRFPSENSVLRKQNSSRDNTGKIRTSKPKSDYHKTSSFNIFPKFSRINKRYKRDPDLVAGDLRLIFIWASVVTGLSILFILLSNPANKTVSRKYESYIQKAMENKSENGSILIVDSKTIEELANENTVLKADSNFGEDSNRAVVINNEIKRDIEIQDEIIKQFEPVFSTDGLSTIKLSDKLDAATKVVDSKSNLVKKDENTQKTRTQNNSKNELETATIIKPKANGSVRKSDSNSDIKIEKKRIKNLKLTMNKPDEKTKLLLALSSRQNAEDLIKKALHSFEGYYRSGNAAQLVSLYSKSANENKYSSRDQIRVVYEKYFSSLSAQNINFSIRKIKKLHDNQFLVSGRFIGSAKRSLFKEKSFNTSFTMRFQLKNSEMKIVEMNY